MLSSSSKKYLHEYVDVKVLTPKTWQSHFEEMGFWTDACSWWYIEVENKALGHLLFLNVSSPMMESSYALVGKDAMRQLGFENERKGKWFLKKSLCLICFGVRVRNIFVNVWMWRFSLRRCSRATSRRWGSEQTYVHEDISKLKPKPKAICFLVEKIHVREEIAKSKTKPETICFPLNRHMFTKIYRSRSQNPRP